MIFTTIYGKPYQTDCTLGFPAEQAEYIQRVAQQTVLEKPHAAEYKKVIGFVRIHARAPQARVFGSWTPACPAAGRSAGRDACPHRSLSSSQRIVFSSIDAISSAMRCDCAVSSSTRSVPDEATPRGAAFSASSAGISVSSASSSLFSLNELARHSLRRLCFRRLRFGAGLCGFGAACRFVFALPGQSRFPQNPDLAPAAENQQVVGDLVHENNGRATPRSRSL